MYHARRYARRLAFLCALTVCGAPSVSQAEDEDAYVCPEFPEPTVSLQFGSRYKDDDKSRSDKDEESDAEVTAALKPSDDFVRGLTKVSNEAISEPEVREDATSCVLEAVAAWARADAFSDMRTVTARISYPARVGGIAVAYAQVLPFADPESESQREIDAWLRLRADEMILFWNTEAPPLASQANLRAWAAMAITQIGLILDEPDYLDWGLLSQRIILDTQDEDGSLPLEMRRGKYGLHYQLHAMAPMSVTTALLCQAGYRNPEHYERLLEDAVTFSLAAIEDPKIAEEITGKAQTIKAGLENQKNFVLAWLEAYLNFSYDPKLDARLDSFRPLKNSKLGGDLTMLYRNNLDRPLGCRERDNI
jgi:poly(beta-D-mannuronate) lyase